MSFNTDDQITIKGRVVRERGELVEAQLPDGQLLRIALKHVSPAAAADSTAKQPTHKAVKLGQPGTAPSAR